MARALKVYRTHIGFFDMVVAAHSQKEAMVAWGGSPAEFQKGFASVTSDEKATSAALSKPGVVFYRPFGSEGAFSTERSLAKVKLKGEPPSLRPPPKKTEQQQKDGKKALKASAKEAARTAQENRKRERENRKRELQLARENEKREREEKRRELKRLREEAKEKLDRTLKKIVEEELELERRRADARADYEKTLKDLT